MCARSRAALALSLVAPALFVLSVLANCQAARPAKANRPTVTAKVASAMLVVCCRAVAPAPLCNPGLRYQVAKAICIDGTTTVETASVRESQFGTPGVTHSPLIPAQIAPTPRAA